ncbi:TPA: class I SAM-dependent methyltransferase [Candidatus Micrarchaeota archaeon]|nr:class I SAM-dependent methyltransferase [Candidatus Micrarchaeota archaeon]
MACSSVDRVYLHNVLNAAGVDQGLMLREVHRVLKPNDRVLIVHRYGKLSNPTECFNLLRMYFTHDPEETAEHKEAFVHVYDNRAYYGAFRKRQRA